MGINLSESEWCRKATPEVPCRTQGFSQYPTASRRGRGWWHHGVPSHSYKMAASQCAVNILTEEQKRSRRARVQEELRNDPLRCSMFIYLTACGRVKWLHRGPLRCAFSPKTLWNCIYLYVCVFWFMVFKSACVPPHLTRNVAKIQVVRVSTSKVIVIVLLIRACRSSPSRLCAYQPQRS